ncbi:hypothetical protein ACLESO_24340 [Pyxidicoccus sp. 3LG]
MTTSRIVASLALCFSLSLVACGGGEVPVDEAGTEAPMSSMEQGLGMPPNCPNGDLFYWLENEKLCGTCGTTRNPGRTATQYAACRSNVSGSKTLINTRYCIPGCAVIE